MSKVAVSAFITIVSLICVAHAYCPFSANFNVSWDTTALGWIVNGEFMPEVTVAGGEIGIFNVSSSAGKFYLATRSCDTRYALSRKEGVTNNACTPPCTVAFNLTSNYYYMCSSAFSDSTSGVLHVLGLLSYPL